MNELLHYVHFCPCACIKIQNMNFMHCHTFMPNTLVSSLSVKTADVMGCLREPTNACLQFFIVLISFSN